MAFMKKKTKQRCKTILSLFFALTLIMSAVTFAVSAAEAAALSVQLKTDKEEYTADEDIALTLEIRNGGTGRLVDARAYLGCAAFREGFSAEDWDGERLFSALQEKGFSVSGFSAFGKRVKIKLYPDKKP